MNGKRFVPSEGVVLRSIDARQARDEILDLFKRRSGSSLYYSDICSELDLPIEQVYSVCNELEREGLIGEGGCRG
jgi:hypothetical protein